VITIVITAVVGGCIGRSGTVPQQVGSVVATGIIGCYAGTAYLFVDSTVQGSVRRDFRQWLVLDSSNERAGGRLGGGRLVVGGSHPVHRVNWEKRGDSILVVEMTFPSASWMLTSTTGGLKGRAHFTSDVVRVDADGRRFAEQSDWPAQLQRTSCKEVPDASSRGGMWK